MGKSKGETCMVEEPPHVKQLSLNHVCKIGLNIKRNTVERKLMLYSQLSLSEGRR
jgi:hypothetical protein